MRRLFFIAGIALFVLGCTAPDPEQEKAKVENRDPGILRGCPEI